MLDELLPEDVPLPELPALAPRSTRSTCAGNVRPGNASTWKVAAWPAATSPTSASSTFTSRRIARRSSAITNSTGALNEAATVWPGSTSRDRTTPVTGERIRAFENCVWSDESCARACATDDSAVSTAASARACSARAVSSSAADGTFPFDNRLTSSRRASDACASCAVARACATPAMADCSAASPCLIESCRRDVSSLASTWPLLTRSLLSTATSVTRPESSEPTSTSFVGWRLPVAETVTRRLPRSTGAVA